MNKKTLLLTLCLAWIPAFAGMTQSYAQNKSIFLPAHEVSRNRETIKRIEDYLSNITTITAEFSQVAPDGGLASGKFYLKRPGKMRWQYNPPTPVLMVSNGSEFVFYDYELKQVTYLPLDGTLISFLAKKNISFDGDVGITYLKNEAEMIRIEVAQKAKPNEGRLMLEFSDSPLTLRSMVVTDATGQKTNVSFQNAKFGVPIDKDLFVFRDPRKPVGR